VEEACCKVLLLQALAMMQAAKQTTRSSTYHIQQQAQLQIQ
jgi:hypothetical protein